MGRSADHQMLLMMLPVSCLLQRVHVAGAGDLLGPHNQFIRYEEHVLRWDGDKYISESDANLTITREQVPVHGVEVDAWVLTQPGTTTRWDYKASLVPNQTQQAELRRNNVDVGA